MKQSRVMSLFEAVVNVVVGAERLGADNEANAP